MLKKCFSFLVLIIYTLSLSGCYKNTKEPTEIKNNFWLVSSPVKLAEYDSPYTLAFWDNDNFFNLFIFAAPIQKKNASSHYAAFNNTINTSTTDYFVCENAENNVTVSFPQLLSQSFLFKRGKEEISFRIKMASDLQGHVEQFINMYGDTVQAVVYHDDSIDYVFYPISTGIKMEFILKNKNAKNTFEFQPSFSQNRIQSILNENYIEYKKRNTIKALFYPSLCIDSQMIVKPNQIKQADETIVLSAEQSTHYPIKLDASFEFYANKMPDSTTSSKGSANSYLSNYCSIFNRKSNDVTQHFIRLRINYFMETNAKNIMYASYNIKPLGTADEKEAIQKEVKLREVNSQWSSTQLKWNDKGEIGATISDQAKGIENGYYAFDITQFIKKCVFDTSGGIESCGMVLLSDHENENSTYFATSDNTLYPPYIRIKMKNAPDKFSIMENINKID